MDYAIQKQDLIWYWRYFPVFATFAEGCKNLDVEDLVE